MIKDGQKFNQLIAANTQACLATVAPEESIAPFIIRVEYSQASNGAIIVQLGDTTRHADNLQFNRVASFLLDDCCSARDGLQMSLQVELKPVDRNSELLQRHYQYYPQSRQLAEQSVILFYQVNVLRVDWFGYVHKALQYSGDLIQASPFSYAEELGMIEHMNNDHSQAIQHYCARVSIDYDANDMPVIGGISAYGFHVRVHHRLHWFSFDSPCETVNCVRKALVKMAQS